mgnify:CR=1 FL=1
MIWSVDGIVKGFYTGNAMIVVQFIDQPMQSWLKRSGGLLYLGVGDGLMMRVA